MAAAASPGVLYFLGLPLFLFTDSAKPPDDTVEGTAWEEYTMGEEVVAVVAGLEVLGRIPLLGEALLTAETVEVGAA